MSQSVPSAYSINYKDTEEVIAYAHMLAMSIQSEGGLSEFPSQSAVLRKLYKEGHHWLKEIETVLPDVELRAIPDITDAYDFIHRIVRHTTPGSILGTTRIHALHRWIRGDKSLTEVQIALLIWKMFKENPMNVDDRYVRYYMGVMDNWITEFKSQRCIPGNNDADTYRCLVHLLNSDLFAYVGGHAKQEALKRMWVNRFLVDDFTKLDTTTLRVYTIFYCTAEIMGYIPYGSFRTDTFGHEYIYSDYVADGRCQLVIELTQRADLHPFHRQAYRLELQTMNNLRV